MLDETGRPAPHSQAKPGRRSLSLLPLAQRLLERAWFVRLLNPLMGRFNPFLPE